MICCGLCDGARAAGEVELVGLVHAVVGLDGDERHHEEDEEHAGHRQAVVHGPAALALGVTQLQTLIISRSIYSPSKYWLAVTMSIKSSIFPAHRQMRMKAWESGKAVTNVCHRT